MDIKRKGTSETTSYAPMGKLNAIMKSGVWGNPQSSNLHLQPGTRITKNVAIWVLIASSFLLGFGSAWDAYWHAGIGRDSFWIPPHLLLYSGPLLPMSLPLIAVIVSGLLAKWSVSIDLDFTFGQEYRVALIGSGAMLAAAGLDEIWHRTVGDGLVWTPPHVLGALGGILIAIGTLRGLLKQRDGSLANEAEVPFPISLIFAMLLLVGYFGVLPVTAMTFLPENISFPRIETTNILLPVAIASSTIPAVLLSARKLLGKRNVNVVVMTAAFLWGFIEIFHRLITPLVASQSGYQIREDTEFTAGFRFLVLAAAMLPVILANQSRWRRSSIIGVSVAILYLLEGLVGSLFVNTSFQAVLTMVVVIPLGGLSGKLGEFSATWILRSSKLPKEPLAILQPERERRSWAQE